MTSFGESSQGFTKRLQPLTMCEYEVDCENVVDLSSIEARAREGVDRDGIACAWLTFQLAGKEAPSWIVADRLRGAGACGVLVPSFAPGATDATSTWCCGAGDRTCKQSRGIRSERSLA